MTQYEQSKDEVLAIIKCRIERLLPDIHYFTSKGLESKLTQLSEEILGGMTSKFIESHPPHNLVLLELKGIQHVD